MNLSTQVQEDVKESCLVFALCMSRSFRGVLRMCAHTKLSTQCASNKMSSLLCVLALEYLNFQGLNFRDDEAQACQLSRAFCSLSCIQCISSWMYFTIHKKRSVATPLYHDFKVQTGIGSKNNLMDD